MIVLPALQLVEISAWNVEIEWALARPGTVLPGWASTGNEQLVSSDELVAALGKIAQVIDGRIIAKSANGTNLLELAALDGTRISVQLGVEPPAQTRLLKAWEQAGFLAVAD